MRFLAGMLIIITASMISADPWKLAVQSNLTTTLNSYSDNWTGGDVGTFSWAAQMQAIAEKQFNVWLADKTTLKLSFGQTETQDPKSKTWSRPAKSSDQIDGESVLRFTLGGFVDPYAALHVQSLFLYEYYDANNIRLQLHGNPVDLTESFGITRTFLGKPEVNLISRFGGAVRENINRVRPNDSLVQTDGGLELITDLKAAHPSKVITFISKLQLYEALFRVNPDSLNYWRYPDVNWENTMNVNIAKYIMFSLYVQMLYDREVIEAHNRIRLKETLSAGLTFNWEWPATAPAEKK
jgi:hypothetical protein